MCECAFIYIMNYSTFEPLYNNNLEEQSNINNFGHFFPLYSDTTGQINTNKEQNIQNYYERKEHIQKYIKQNQLISLKSLFKNATSYYLTKDKQIIKTRTSYMEFKKPSYNEIQYIIKWNPKYFK